MKYQAVKHMLKEEAEQRLATAGLEELPLVVASLYLVDDVAWVQGQLERLLGHPDVWVAGTAVMAFSDLARIGVELDEPMLGRRFDELLQLRPELEGRISSCLADLAHFWRLDGSCHPRPSSP